MRLNLKIALVLAGISFLEVQIVAQSPQDSVLTIERALHENFDWIDNLQVECESLEKKSPAGTLSSYTFNYCSNGSNYKMSVKGGYKDETLSLAYDGRYGQTLFPNGSLHLTKKPVDPFHNEWELSKRNAYFMSFWFLNTETFISYYGIDQLSFYKSKKTIDAFFVPATHLGEKKIGQFVCQVIHREFPIINAKILNGLFPGSILAGNSFNVYFCKELGWFPVKWKILNKNGNILIDYTVMETGTFPSGKGRIFFAKKAIFRDFGMYSAKVAEEPSTIMELNIKSVIFNNTSLDEEMFSIDPSFARRIYDTDEDKGIAVPK